MKTSLSSLRSVRERGFRPAEIVFLSLVGDLAIENPVVSLEGEGQLGDHDFNALIDLFVVMVGVTSQAGRLVELADRLCRGGVRHLECWNVETDHWVSVLYNYKKFIRSVPPCN